MIKEVDLLLVIGASNSSNSNRLKDIGSKNDIPSYLIENISDLDNVNFDGVIKIGATAGASAPEFLMDELINYLNQKFIVELKTIHGKQEKFRLTYQKYCKMFKVISKFLLIFFGVIMTVNAQNVSENDILVMKLKYGEVKIQMFEDVAPNHVARIKELANDGFYDNITFHRVIDGFMAQTGDPRGDGTGGSGKNLKAEFSNVKHERGIVSMARAQNVNSADSQFFIMLDDSPHLDGQYTVWGKVISGMEYIDQIQKGDPYMNGTVGNPDKILSLRTVANDR